MITSELSHKAIFKCHDSYKTQFSRSHCLLTISVGQEAHEGEKFALTVDLVNRSFASATILVDDSLQRHSLRLLQSLTAEQAYQYSLHAGHHWLQRNSKTIDTFSIPLQIRRWNDWLHHPAFISTKTLLMQEFEKNQGYHQAMTNSATQYIQRLQQRNSVFAVNKQQAYELCLDYLFEECTALYLWHQYANYDFEVYPSKRSSAMAATHTIFIAPTAPDKLLPVAIKFKKRRQWHPQNIIYSLSA